MLVAKNISLAFIGYFPFFVAVFNNYVERPKKLNADTKLAVQIGSVAIFAASLAQAVVFIVALWKGSSHLGPRANPSISRNSHCYLALKLTIIPIASLFIYFTTFTDYTVIYIAFHTVVFITPLLFLVLKLIFSRRERGVTIALTYPSYGRKLRDQKKGASETVPLLTA